MLQKALAICFQLEGGESNDPNDRGGQTKYGISKKAYPYIDIGNLTREQAEKILQRDYWVPAGCEFVKNPNIAINLFLFAVNAGVQTSVKAFQRAYNKYVYEYFVFPTKINAHQVKSTIEQAGLLAEDGVLGQQTIKAMSNAGFTDRFFSLFYYEILHHYLQVIAKYPSQIKYLNGWVKRIIVNDE